MYARVVIKTLAVDQPGDLPPELIGLADESLADLSAALKPTPTDLRGVGYWPVTTVSPPIDAAAQTYADGLDLLADKKARTVTATRQVRDLTPEEIRARYEAENPLPLEMGKLWLIKAMREVGIKDDFDRAMAEADEETLEDWEASYNIRRTHPLVNHFTTALGKDAAYVDDLYRRAAAIKAAEV